jgi:hypothetical protein
MTDFYIKYFRNWRFKRTTVFFGEKKFAKTLTQLDIKTQTVVSEEILINQGQHFGPDYNPSIFFGLEMYEAGVFPGLKRTLLATKPFIIN